MSETLYRKYRPRKFSEVVGQEHVVRTLMGALTTGRIGHAFLFTGPRGTGKTTLARIFAKSLNCVNYRRVDERRAMTERERRNTEISRLNVGNTESSSLNVPCNSCDSCLAANLGNSLDLIEIDGASNRNIDDVRNFKESANVAIITKSF